MIGNPAEGKGSWDLEVETNGCKGITGKSGETEAADNGWRVGIETTLRTVVAKRNENVDPDSPVGELRKTF